jgi:hypothetical protein
LRGGDYIETIDFDSNSALGTPDSRLCFTRRFPGHYEGQKPFYHACSCCDMGGRYLRCHLLYGPVRMVEADYALSWPFYYRHLESYEVR